MGEPACFGKHSIVQKVNYCSRIHVCLSERIVLFMGGDPSLKVGRGGYSQCVALSKWSATIPPKSPEIPFQALQGDTMTTVRSFNCFRFILS